MSWEIIVAWAALICGAPNESCQLWAEKCLVNQVVLTGDPDLSFEYCAENLPVDVIVAMMAKGTK